MAKIKVSELAQLDESKVNDKTSLLAVDSNQSYQLKYGFLSSNLSSNLYRPITETVSAECDIQQQKDDIAALSATSKNLCAEIQLSTQTLTSEIDNKIDKTTIATSTNLGLIKVGYYTDVDRKNYAVQLNEEKQAYVHVPLEGGSGGSDPRIDTLAIMSSYYVSSDNIAIPRMNYNSIKLLSGYVNQAFEETELLNDLVDKIAMFDDDSNLSSGLLYDLSSEVSAAKNKIDDIDEISDAVDKIAMFDDDSNLSSGLLYDLSSEVSAAKFMLGSGNAKSDSSNNWITLTADSLVIAVVKNSQNTDSKIEYKENSDATPITVAGCTSSDIEIVSNFTIHAKANVMFRLTGATTNLITIS